MAKDLHALIERLKELEAEIMRQLEDLAKEMALNAKALAERKILDIGIGQYSKKTYPAYWLHGKELNLRGTKFLADRGVNPTTGVQGQGKKKRRKKGERGDPGRFSIYTNWGEFREGQGLQNDHVDLHYSNKMFAGIGVDRVVHEGTFIIAYLGHNNKEGQDKMNWNFERYGDFFDKALGDEGRQLIRSIAASRISQILQNFQF